MSAYLFSAHLSTERATISAHLSGDESECADWPPAFSPDRDNTEPPEPRVWEGDYA